MAAPPFPYDYLQEEYRRGRDDAQLLKSNVSHFAKRLNRHQKIAAEHKKTPLVPPVKAYLKALKAAEKATSDYKAEAMQQARLVKTLERDRDRLVKQDLAAYDAATDDATRTRIVKRFKKTLKGALDALFDRAGLGNKLFKAVEGALADLEKAEKKLPALFKRTPSR